MNNYIQYDEWNIIEKGFVPSQNEISESLFSIGNGYIGQRANFEESYSGKSLQGSYIAGVYYPDKTRVGWWKNGYPEYFAKVINSINWTGIKIKINNQELDLAKCQVSNFMRVLNMKEGHLNRSFTASLPNGNKVKVNTQRFISMTRNEIGAIRYSIVPLNFDGIITFTPYLDGDVKNLDSNYDKKFWNSISQRVAPYTGYVELKTKKLDFYIASFMHYSITKNGEILKFKPVVEEKEKYAANTLSIDSKSGDEITLYKYVATTSNRYYNKDKLYDITKESSEKAFKSGYNKLLIEQKDTWAKIWKHSDITIEGDIAAQQGIRFNIFHLNQTYNGKDDRLNIGPKGFTGEKYGGSTYWDTEAFCLPFYLSTADEQVSKNLLMYRYKHLDKAIKNAETLGFTGGAALYPMVTMNGEECHNEWEITFEEIHRNGAIAYAIYNYTNYTGDTSYLEEYGFEVLVAISRFWAQRINFSKAKNKYVLLGVTGPNEYENNVNNNWYTNRIAVWTLQYTLDTIYFLKENRPNKLEVFNKKLHIKNSEITHWKEIIANMYYPIDKKRDIFLQQDNFLDKDLKPASNINADELPISQHWSWDRILRSCFIKQADVLQGLYCLEHEYDVDTIKRNFEFYEPITVHESSLSPCIHAVLACKIGNYDKAYEMYLRTSRLDLDNYNNDSSDGCHITSMAGSWIAIVQGFGGLRVRNSKLILNPYIPNNWKKYSFNIIFRKNFLKITVEHDNVIIVNNGNQNIHIKIYNKDYTVKCHNEIKILH